MMKRLFSLLFCLMAVSWTACAKSRFETDNIGTGAGDLKITFIGHGSLIFNFAGKVIHVDPYGKLADYSTLPKADLVLVTHEHPDHLDAAAIDKVRKKDTEIVLTEAAAKLLPGGTVMRNGDVKTVKGFRIEAVPAYNLVHKRPDGKAFHPKGTGNGYVISFGDKRVYVAGDTENIPEMKALAGVDVAFIPMNLPYTMTPEMAADAARLLRPGILYPYHYGETDVAKFLSLVKDMKDTDVRVRKMK